MARRADDGSGLHFEPENEHVRGRRDGFQGVERLLHLLFDVQHAGVGHEQGHGELADDTGLMVAMEQHVDDAAAKEDDDDVQYEVFVGGC